jgi:hypothetical protein
MEVVCKECLGEKIRIALPRGGYRYACGCKEWKKNLQVLELARRRKKKGR